MIKLKNKKKRFLVKKNQYYFNIYNGNVTDGCVNIN